MSTETTGTTRGTALKTAAADIANGFVAITHSSLALLGLGVLVAGGVLAYQPELRADGEIALRTWLQDRHVATLGITPEPNAIERATAVNPADLPKEQAEVAFWISKKYKVAPEPLAALVSEAYEIGTETKLEPTLLLAIMAVESSFNPFAQSPVGAQGLMQVMTKIHSDKYEHFGGMHAAFDPKTNLRVGVQVLQECIRRAGSLRGGLKYYVGAANHATDGGYGDKVMRHFDQLYRVAKGKPLPNNYNVEPRTMTAQNRPKKHPAPAPAAVVPAAEIPSSPETTAANTRIGAPLSEHGIQVSDALRYVSPVHTQHADQLAQAN